MTPSHTPPEATGKGGLRVLIGCESSGVMRRAFAALGHDAWSCDLLPSEDGSNRHICGDVRDHLAEEEAVLEVYKEAMGMGQ